MRIETATMATCGEARGVVIVIDVIRAFTTAAVALAAGASAIVPVSGVEEALQGRERWPGALVMGEVGGLPPAGFDFGNSPSALLGRDLGGRRLIQRTGAGTQGLVRSRQAEVLFAASFVCAAATARAVRALRPDTVTLLPTDHLQAEDPACAEYLAARLRDETPDPAPYLARVRAGGLARVQPGPANQGWPEWAVSQFLADLDLCAAVDRYDFAMRVERRADGLLLTAQPA